MRTAYDIDHQHQVMCWLELDQNRAMLLIARQIRQGHWENGTPFRSEMDKGSLEARILLIYISSMRD